MASFHATVAGFAEKQGVDYVTASGLLRYLVEKGVVKKDGKKSAKGGKGKPSDIFLIPDSITLDFVPAPVEMTEAAK